MAGNDIRVDLTGDSTGLQAALKRGERSLADFSKNAGGYLGSFAGNSSTALGKLNSGIGGLVGVATLAAGSITGLVLASNSYIKTLNDLSKLSGMTVVELQQMQKAFYTTGLNIDQIANANKDSLDKWGDAFRNGGGISDDAKELGLNLDKYAKNLNRVDGGIRNIIQSYYDLQKMGKTRAEIVNFLESQGNDMSALAPKLAEFRTESEAINYILGQQAVVTDETAKKYQEFDQNLEKLTGRIKGTIAEGINPLVAAMNAVYESASTPPKEAGLFEDLNDQIKKSTGSLQDMYDIWQSLRLAGALNYQGGALVTGAMDNGRESEAAKRIALLKQKSIDLQNDVNGIKVKNNDKKGFINKDKLKAEQDKLASQAAAAAAAAKAAAEAKRLEQERIQAQAAIDKIRVDMISDAGQRQIAEFDRQQNEMVLSIKKNGKKLQMADAEVQALLLSQAKGAAVQRTKLLDDMVGIDRPNQGLQDQNNLLKSGNLNQEQKNSLIDKQNQRTYGDNPFAYNNTDQKLKDNQEALRLELEQNELLLAGTEEFEKNKAAIQAKYNRQQMEIMTQNTRDQLSIFGQAAGDIGSVVAGVFGESSAAAKVAFGVQKAISMATTIMNIQTALSQALATPFPASLAAYGQIASMGMKIISTAKGASGQFHGGVDELPQSLNNKSFVLKAGERVVQPEANKKLSAFLDNQGNNNSTTGGEITINAPMIVQGTIDDDSKFQELTKKHANAIAQAVRQSQQRNT